MQPRRNPANYTTFVHTKMLLNEIYVFDIVLDCPDEPLKLS